MMVSPSKRATLRRYWDKHKDDINKKKRIKRMKNKKKEKDYFKGLADFIPSMVITSIGLIFLASTMESMRKLKEVETEIEYAELKLMGVIKIIVKSRKKEKVFYLKLREEKSFIKGFEAKGYKQEKGYGGMKMLVWYRKEKPLPKRCQECPYRNEDRDYD